MPWKLGKISRSEHSASLTKAELSNSFMYAKCELIMDFMHTRTQEILIIEIESKRERRIQAL